MTEPDTASRERIKDSAAVTAFSIARGALSPDDPLLAERQRNLQRQEYKRKVMADAFRPDTRGCRAGVALGASDSPPLVSRGTAAAGRRRRVQPLHLLFLWVSHGSRSADGCGVTDRLAQTEGCVGCGLRDETMEQDLSRASARRPPEPHQGNSVAGYHAGAVSTATAVRDVGI